MTLQRQIYAGEQAEIDLQCLTLASQLWPLTGRHRDARRLLSEVSATHAEWLRWQGRNREAFQCAERVQELVRQDEPDCPVVWGLLTAVHVSAGVIASGRGRDSGSRAVELLRSWLSAGATPQWETSLYRDMVDYGVQAGDLEAAWEFSLCARAAAERTDDAGQTRIANRVQARVLTCLGRYREALALLPTDEDAAPICRLLEALLWAKVLLGLEQQNDAEQCVARAYELIAAYGYSQWRANVDELARQL